MQNIPKQTNNIQNKKSPEQDKIRKLCDRLQSKIFELSSDSTKYIPVLAEYPPIKKQLDAQRAKGEVINYKKYRDELIEIYQANFQNILDKHPDLYDFIGVSFEQDREIRIDDADHGHKPLFNGTPGKRNAVDLSKKWTYEGKTLAELDDQENIENQGDYSWYNKEDKHGRVHLMEDLQKNNKHFAGMSEEQIQQKIEDDLKKINEDPTLR